MVVTAWTGSIGGVRVLERARIVAVRAASLNDLLCRSRVSSMPTPACKRSCAAKNRMRESRSCGSVSAEGSNALGYSEISSYGSRGFGSIAGGSEHPTPTEAWQAIRLMIRRKPIQYSVGADAV